MKEQMEANSTRKVLVEEMEDGEETRERWLVVLRRPDFAVGLHPMLAVAVPVPVGDASRSRR